MTSFHRLSALKAIALGVALSMTAGLAMAGDDTPAMGACMIGSSTSSNASSV